MRDSEVFIAHPPVSDRAAWLEARQLLLEQERALTRESDRVNALRRRLPMVKLHKSYLFHGPDGDRTLLDLFEGRRQLLVYHFMFDPAWEAGCPGCTGFVNALGSLDTLAERDATLVLVSRAPLEKLLGYKAKMGWTLPWYSSESTDFNIDFGVTLDPSLGPIAYNYKSGEVLGAYLSNLDKPEEMTGLSVFFRLDDSVFHTYSTYARGVENLTDAVRLLDVTPYGRQEDFEDSPDGWPQKPTYG